MTYSDAIRRGTDAQWGGVLGLFSLTADFNENAVSGEFEFDPVDAALGNDGSITLALATAPITGNGFARDLIATDCSFGTCTTDNSAVGGVFYGADAEEVAGTILFDVTATNDAGESDQVTGVAAFGGAPPM